ncbi:tRNA (cytidine(34)-2'-O)-methyltransferase [Nitratifractor salsuginis]|uniref:Putative tRNA (cytidine(34)-2'-O)-methyltransferase n=1 Tax=Nitratifractor salsuginis (strain DSM 16511 / JCM 12458 / E9I37-1) TaxID=749222 RepID=E6X156_NITSE|nr:tRNA (cytidine(34)-2'-O)-methyltransferase [Nitratifractor salsuginis]ADV45859.1 tRNA/rRNA methyltransferase (SpoU) [Nitratifractor salsuginis DSM 16511]
MFNIVLVHPKIPPNTGNIARLCVNLGAKLHLIEPLGFDISEKAVRRAGLDYWKDLDLTVWESIEAFLAEHPIDGHCHLATTKTERLYWEAEYHPGDWLIFGSETEGLPAELLQSRPDRCITIPMSPAGRSINLSVAVGIVAYEALRQSASRLGELRM